MKYCELEPGDILITTPNKLIHFIVATKKEFYSILEENSSVGGWRYSISSFSRNGFTTSLMNFEKEIDSKYRVVKWANEQR